MTVPGAPQLCSQQLAIVDVDFEGDCDGDDDDAPRILRAASAHAGRLSRTPLRAAPPCSGVAHAALTVFGGTEHRPYRAVAATGGVNQAGRMPVLLGTWRANDFTTVDVDLDGDGDGDGDAPRILRAASAHAGRLSRTPLRAAPPCSGDAHAALTVFGGTEHRPYRAVAVTGGVNQAYRMPVLLGTWHANDG